MLILLFLLLSVALLAAVRMFYLLSQPDGPAPPDDDVLAFLPMDCPICGRTMTPGTTSRAISDRDGYFACKEHEAELLAERAS